MSASFRCLDYMAAKDQLFTMVPRCSGGSVLQLLPRNRLVRIALSRFTSTARSPTARPQDRISTNGSGWRASDINRKVADPAGWWGG